MFVPVGCAECGKHFQVERGQLGQPATCPWCGAHRVAAEPLPLPLPLPEDVRAERPKRAHRVRSTTRLRVVRWLALAALCTVLALATFAGQHYRHGGFSSLAMESFVAPDG